MRSRVFKIDDVTNMIPDDEVKTTIAIEVDKIKREKCTHSEAAERIIIAGTLNETRRSRCSCVLKVVDTITTTPDDEVKIIVIVNIDKFGSGIRACIDVVERIGLAGALNEIGICRCAGIFIVTEITVINSDSKVQVAVTVQVSQCERAQ